MIGEMSVKNPNECVTTKCTITWYITIQQAYSSLPQFELPGTKKQSNILCLTKVHISQILHT